MLKIFLFACIVLVPFLKIQWSLLYLEILNEIFAGIYINHNTVLILPKYLAVLFNFFSFKKN